MQAEAEAQFTPKQLKFLKTVGGMYNSNTAKSLNEILEECGVPHDIAYSKNPGLLDEHIPFEKGSDAYNVFFTYLTTVSKRYELQSLKLNGISGETFGVNLHQGEAIYHALYRATLMQEKTTVTNIAYSGAVWKSGPLRTGSLSVISNEITRFAPVDSGKVLFTNERVIFIGRHKNVTKQIKIDDILSCNLYKDGVLLNVPNKKPLLFKFDEYQEFDIYDVSDQVNQFVLVMNRMMAHNYEQNLASTLEHPNADVIGQIQSALVNKNYDERLARIICEAKAGEKIRTSIIQRDLQIGYHKADILRNQLVRIGLIDTNDEWIVNGNDVDTLVEMIRTAESNTESPHGF